MQKKSYCCFFSLNCMATGFLWSHNLAILSRRKDVTDASLEPQFHHVLAAISAFNLKLCYIKLLPSEDLFLEVSFKSSHFVNVFLRKHKINLYFALFTFHSFPLTFPMITSPKAALQLP